MNYKSLQSKIILIFSIPMIALIYFSYSFIGSKSEQLHLSKAQVLAAEVTHMLTDLIHAIQTERGLSAGFIVVNSPKLKKTLLEQQLITDSNYEKFLEYFQNKSKKKDTLNRYLHRYNKKNIISIINNFHEISDIRKQVLHHKILLTDELSYYTEINKKLLEKYLRV